MSRIIVKPPEIPNEYFPVAQIFTDGNGKFAFYADDILIEFLANASPGKRTSIAKEITKRLFLHLLTSAIDRAKVLLASKGQCN